ncbi:MAG: hypothetical protein M1132_08950 [Chloroflexi bacterium]|nr:hypothetical protein [Chloroflexota bacterium]
MHTRVLSQFALALAGLVMLVVFQPQYPRVASAQPAPAPQATGTMLATAFSRPLPSLFSLRDLPIRG